ncbi:hypothetical protein F441_10919, partial [Phytophthora nicotianae CJ01A1]
MASRKPVTAAALAGFITAGLAAADVPIAVYHDATYSLSESCGIPCSGVGAEPVGTACPKAGDVATSDCQPYLLSYNGAVCVAPTAAECVLIHDDVWGCEFPKTSYTSAVEAETIAAYDGESSSWEAGHDEGVQVGDEEEETPTGVHYDTTVDAPLGVNCEVATETPTQGHTTEGGKYYGSTGTATSPGTTESTSGGKTTVDHGTTIIHYGSTITEGVVKGGYGPADAKVVDSTTLVDHSTDTTETTESGNISGGYDTAGTITESGATTEGYTTGGTTHETTEGGTVDYNADTTEESPDTTTVDYKPEETGGQHYETPSEVGAQDYTPETDKPCDDTDAPTHQTTYAPTEETTYG